MKKPTFNNYGWPAIIMFASFILLSFYTSEQQHMVLELRSDTASRGMSFRSFVAMHDSMINDTSHTLNNHFKFIKAEVN